MEETLFYIAAPLLAFGVPVLFYFIINYVNRKLQQMDQELERRTEAVTTTELTALLHDAVSESLAVLLAQVEQNGRRLEELEQLLAQPRPWQTHVEAPQSLQGSTLLETDSESEEADLGEALPSRERIRSQPT